MKPINIKKIGFAVCLMSILSFTGCVNDDLSVCGITIVFKYTNNMERVDKFDSDVKNVNLYIFDSEGIFLNEFKLEGSNSIKLNLMSGKYNLVAWGNLTNSYTLPVLESGVTKLEDFILKLNHLSNEITEFPTPLFYGGIMGKEIKGDKMFSQVDTINMIKDTKYIKVIYKPFTYENVTESNFTCEISSLSAELKYDNTVTGFDILEYKPKLSLDDESQQVSLFALTREYGTETISPTNSKLKVSYTPSNGTPTEVIKEADLLPLLIARLTAGASMEIQDTFNITLVFDFTFGNIDVTVKDWNSEGGGVIVE